MAWDPINDPCDYIKLAGQKSPGLADVSGASSIREWEERNGYGLTGGRSIFMRRKLSRFSVKIRLYTEEEWAEFQEWRKVVDKLPTRRGGNNAASGMLDIWHPLLEELDIKAVGVAEVLQPEQTEDGVWTYEIRFIEFRQPKVTLARPDAAKATPVDPVDTYIEKKLDEFRALSSEGPPPLPVPP
jgi:hypothetical protein